MERDEITQSFPPSHILQDGRFIFLPEPSDRERSKFLERSISRHKLLNEEVKEEDGDEVQGDDKKEEEGAVEDSTQQKIHPLAVASARLQANGVSELSKAINLTNLVSAGVYFGSSNIVNPQLETGVDKTNDKEVEVPVNAEDLALRALYLGKRKRAQFKWASEALERHEKRLAGALATQRIIDQRLLALRPRWRLVAPEHGTRARPHATRPTEVIAIDVDVYDRDRTGGGNQALVQSQHAPRAAVGLARLVPRYATVELPKDYKAAKDVAHWKSLHDLQDTHMSDSDDAQSECKTRAEPFAVADPTLGKIDIDFNPDKVPMLSLQLDIEKDSTGFRQCARLSPLTTLGDNATEDEKVVVALQHSLFCASLFESIRREIIPSDSTHDGTNQKVTQHNEVWLSSAMEEHYLPPSSRMVGSTGLGGSLAVVHCHEGEVKVQLNSEYALTIKLVEAGTAVDSNVDLQAEDDEVNGSTKYSGSQSPQQLHALCRALLLHAQDVYHRHSIELREHMVKKKKEEQTTKKIGLETRKKEDEIPSALILQNCVSLGVRMIFERKVRWALARVTKWLGSRASDAALDKLVVEWLPLSVFDKCSQFVLHYGTFVIDVTMERDEMTITRFGDSGEYRKVRFHSEEEFETFLKLELQKRLKAKNGNGHSF
jgi:hypothetical protein